MAAWVYRERTREMRLAAQRLTFVNQVSHELKTPLTNIRLYAELLDEALDAEGDDEDVRHLRVIVGESQRLSRLISNVLTFARGQEGRIRCRPAPGCIDDIVRDTLAAFDASFEALDLELTTQLDAPARVQIDRDALEQILSNLLDNVEKYAASGGSVKIATAASGEVTTLTVADNGPGVPEAHRQRIFEPFAPHRRTREGP